MKNKQIYDYTLQKLLGKGGMAEVWYAENALGVGVAVKILAKEFCYNEQIKQRFETEAKIMVKLTHPNIRKVVSYGEIDERPAIIMEYLQGEDLSSKLKSGANYTNKDLIHWWNQAVSALQHTHSQGVIHRDVKPSNLFITQSGELKLLDFGIAKVKASASSTLTGQTMGTPLYMSPEQVKDSKHIDSSTDAYSLAVSFAQLLSRQNPYGLSNEASRFDIETAIINKTVPTESLPHPWNTLLQAYLHKASQQRQTLRAYKEEKTKILSSEKTKIIHTFQEEAEETALIPEQNIELLPEKRLIKQKLLSKDIYKYGFIDKSGKEVIPLKYDDAWHFSEGLAKVKLNGKWGFIDKFGQEVIPLKYDFVANEFLDGLARVELNGKYGFIDKTGKEVIPLKYDFVADKFLEGLAKVNLDGKYGFIDQTGQEVIPLKYDFVANEFLDGLAKVNLDGKYGFIDQTGQEVVPLKYDDAWNFSDGLARVRLNGKWGFIDKNGKYGFIDKTGKEVIPLKYDFVANEFSDGLAKVNLDGKYGFIDRTGKEVIPLKYDDADSFSDGLAKVSLDVWGGIFQKRFYINKKGEKVKDAE